MKISTQMKVILTQDELKEAAFAYLGTKMELADDPVYTVEFEDDDKGDLTAIINIETVDDEGGSEPKTKPAGKGRGRKAKQAEPEVKVEVATESKTETETETEMETEAVEEKADDAPWEDDKIEADPVNPSKVPSAATPKIFSDPVSSAAPSTKPEPDPAVAAKSLFANLKPPVNNAH